MTPEYVVDIVRHCLLVAVQVSIPFLGIMLVIGLGISIFQAVTQITESTLIFIPKLLLFCLTLAIALPWVIGVMMDYTNDIFLAQWAKVLYESR